MTRAQWAKHALSCPYQVTVGRRCHWADVNWRVGTLPKCRERNCPALDPERHPWASLYQMLARRRTAPSAT